jgi:hypothetical protein
LQTLLRDIEQVKRIVNDVDVVSSTGLSSEQPKKNSFVRSLRKRPRLSK